MQMARLIADGGTTEVMEKARLIAERRKREAMLRFDGVESEGQLRQTRVAQTVCKDGKGRDRCTGRAGWRRG